MKRIATLLALMMALALAGSASAGNDSDKNHADYWETNGWTCKKFEGNDATKLTFAPFGGFTKYRLILKGGSKFNDGDGFRVIINPAFPNTWYDNPTAGTRTISHYIVCGKHKETTSPGNAYVKSYGPKGDPWYRFTFFNPASRDRDNATCKVVFTGRDGQRVVRRKLSDGQGYKTRWLFVRGSTRVRMVCYEGGQLVFKRTFRSAPGGYYGPLYYGYRAGYFKL